jgi:MoxR-like ATPase
MNTYFKKIISETSEVIKGKEEQIHLCSCAFFIDGHTLIEDWPGLGKTTLAKALSKVFGRKLSRIQCTNDLLPSDIIGYNFYNQATQKMEFIQGAVFSEFLLVDEINRAPAKTQSALLQVMQEREVSIDNKHFKLDPHLHVIATQNPEENIGTFALPESQLDRFCIKLSMGYSDEDETIAIMKKNNDHTLIENLKTVVNTDEFSTIQNEIKEIVVSDEIYKYVYRLINHARNHHRANLSNRAAIDLIDMSKAYAYSQDEKFVTPDTVQKLFVPVCSHRLLKNLNTAEAISLSHTILTEVRSL